MSVTCPACRAVDALASAMDVQCRRCRADLSLLVAVRARRAWLLRQGSVQAAREAHALRADVESLQALAVAHLLRRDFAQALQFYQKRLLASVTIAVD